MPNNNVSYEWVSASTLAQRLGCSTTTIYERIKQGMYETRVFARQGMHGYLIKQPINDD